MAIAKGGSNSGATTTDRTVRKGGGTLTPIVDGGITAITDPTLRVDHPDLAIPAQQHQPRQQQRPLHQQHHHRDEDYSQVYTTFDRPEGELAMFPSSDERFHTSQDARNRMIAYAFHHGFQVRVRSSNETTIYFVCACEGFEGSSRKKGSARLTPDIVPRHRRSEFEMMTQDNKPTTTTQTTTSTSIAAMEQLPIEQDGVELKPRQRSGRTKRCGCPWRAKAIFDRAQEYVYFPSDDGYKTLEHNHELKPEKPASFPQHRRKLEDRELDALVDATETSNIEDIPTRDIRRAIKILERRKNDAARRIDELGQEIAKHHAVIEDSTAKIGNLEERFANGGGGGNGPSAFQSSNAHHDSDVYTNISHIPGLSLTGA